MIANRSQKRPYELTGVEYAAWYTVGQKLGGYAQSIIATALCNGSRTLPEADEITASMVVRVAAECGLTITARS